MSVANIREGFGLGKHRVCGILEELAGAGYVERRQARNPESRFVSVEYVVHDTPRACRQAAEEPENTPSTPLPEDREAVEAHPKPLREMPVPLPTASRISASGKARQTSQGDVLYLALEDNLRRLKCRFEKVSPPPCEVRWLHSLDWATEWPRCDEGGLDALRDRQQHPPAAQRSET